LPNNIYDRDRLFAAIRILDPEGITRRLNDLQRCRGEYIVPGPNYIWSIDGYCKLEFWGIELYAAIDAYSRYIVWVYIGVTNRTGISVLRQYLDHVECEEVAPVVLRSDKGSETTMVAAAHHKIRQGQDPDIAFADCYRFGTSLSNQRIEAWWGQLTKSCLYRWRVCHFYYILLL
jgi:hypothetical protein